MTAERSEISVLLGCANAMSGELLMGALNRQLRFRVVTIATTVQEVLNVAQSERVDVALISATLADRPLSGFGALRRIRACSPGVKSVILLDNEDRKLTVDAFRAGASGVFCPSQSSFKMLCRCVDRVHSGQLWAKRSELVQVMEAFSQLEPLQVVTPDGLRLLTKREEEVVRLLADGLQNREIARELNLSEHTIKNYLFHIFDKLGVSSRVEVVLYAASRTDRKQITSVQRDKQNNEMSEHLLTGTNGN
jgi:DNA-binding NarL/FixJ family response regulator